MAVCRALSRNRARVGQDEGGWGTASRCPRREDRALGHRFALPQPPAISRPFCFFNELLLTVRLVFRRIPAAPQLHHDQRSGTLGLL